MLKAVILTLNEERHIQECIESLRWCDSIVVFDSFSQDATIALAQKAQVEVLQHPFENYAQQRNAALDMVDADWIFFVDADERATPELGKEIQETLAQQKIPVGWWVPRHNYIMGHRMRGTGWWPDHQLRLLRRGYVHYERAVHEVAVLNGEQGYLNEAMAHYNYDTLKHFINKQRRYLNYDVNVLVQENIQPKFYTPYTQGLRHFWWRFVTLNGWQDGVYGILLSTLMAYYEMLKYQRVRKAQKTKSGADEIQ